MADPLPTCPSCDLRNPPWVSTCIQCQAPLGGAPSPSAAPTEQFARPPAARPPLPPPPPALDADSSVDDSDDLLAFDVPEVEPNAPTARFEPDALAALRAKLAQRAAGGELPDDDPAAIGWLIAPPFAPAPVRGTGVVRIGRGSDCELCLPHPSVSREHTVLRCLGPRLVIEDRSSYGTWVNGERIVTHELRPGDAITIGPYQVVYQPAGQTPTPEGDGAEQTRPLTVPGTAEALQGRLEKVGLDEVFQQIELYKKTGTLRVFDEAGFDAVLVAYEGQPMFAEANADGPVEQEDLAVVFRMLALERGNFSFMSKIEAGEMRLSGWTLTALLMEASRRMDEART